MSGVCPICGRQGQLEFHHCTGKIRGKPIHPWFVFRICGPCNRGEYLLWMVAGVADEEPPPIVQLRRVVLWLDTWDQPFDQGQVWMLKRTLADIADRWDVAS